MPQKKEIICVQCRLRFQDVVSLKLHLGTEFHLYNAKRRIAELEPVTEELFLSKKAGKKFYFSLNVCRIGRKYQHHLWHCMEVRPLLEAIQVN